MTGSVVHFVEVPREQVLAFVHNAVVTCRSAAGIHGLPLLGSSSDSAVHLAVPYDRGATVSRLRPGRGVVIHRETHRVDEDQDRPWLASLASTVRRVVLCSSLPEAVAVVDAYRMRGAVDLDDLDLPRRGTGARQAQEVLRRSRPGVRSILETCARLELEDAGIDVEVAVWIQGVGEVDMLVFGRVVVETDGWEHHRSRQQREEDLARDRALQRMGYLVIRFSYDSVMTTHTLVPEVLAMRDHALALPVPGFHSAQADR